MIHTPSKVNIRPFDKDDWMAFSGAASFRPVPDLTAREPLIGEIEWSEAVHFVVHSERNTTPSPIHLAVVGATVIADQNGVGITLETRLDCDDATTIYHSYSLEHLFVAQDVARSEVERVIRLLQMGEIPRGFAYDGEV
jgi:hypothetical protein